MLTGVKGVKYGLQKNPRAPQGGAAKPRAQLAAFAQGDSSDDDQDNVGVQLKRQQAHKAKQAKWEQQHADALAQDSSVFDYDGVYDSIQVAREKPKQAEKAARKSRYIGSMLEKTKERNKEQDILYERQLAREREVEDAVYGDKEKFVTAAYKRKLEEDQKWLEEEKLKEKIEETNDVTKRDGLGDFYRNLHRNAAFGGSRLAAVHVSKEQVTAEERIKKGEDEEQEHKYGKAEGQEQEAAPAAAASTRKPSEELPPASSAREPAPAAADAPRSKAAPPTSAPSQEGDEAPEDPQGAQAAAAANAGKRRNTEDAVAAARQRYLERKRAKK